MEVLVSELANLRGECSRGLILFQTILCFYLQLLMLPQMVVLSSFPLGLCCLVFSVL